MNANEISKMIESTCRDLFSLELIFHYNNPCVNTLGNGNKRVSWPTNCSGSVTAHSFGSLEQYLEWIRNNEFTCLLFDFSIIKVSYECFQAEIVGHNLLYWPCPVEFLIKPQDLTDVCSGIEMCIDSPKGNREIVNLTMRTPMRFDFDPKLESEEHPLIHLHTQFDDTRIGVQQAMSFPTFIKKIFRTFYRNKWLENSEIGDLHDQAIEHDESKFDPLTHCFQVS